MKNRRMQTGAAAAAGYAQGQSPENRAVVDNMVDNVDNLPQKMWTIPLYTVHKSNGLTVCSSFGWGGCGVPFCFFLSFSFLSGERKENQKRKPGTRLGRPAAPARQRNLSSPQKIFCGAFL